MNHRTISVALTAAMLLFGASLTPADEHTGSVASEANGKASASVKGEAKVKAAGKVKLVDINRAKKGELVKLPGVSDVEADKIIAGRPYGSKAHLVTRQILPEGTYQAVKGLIIAKQPTKDAATNAAQFAPKK